MMVIDNKFEIGQIIYLTTDPEQFPRLITGIIVNPQSLMYRITLGNEESIHYDFEITPEPKFMEEN